MVNISANIQEIEYAWFHNKFPVYKPTYIMDTLKSSEISHEIIYTSPESTFPPMSKRSKRLAIIVNLPKYFHHYIMKVVLCQ